MRRMTLSRREAISLLGVGAGVGLVSRLGFAQNAAIQPAFERGAVIRTLLKDVAPATIDGPVLFREHLSIR